MKFNIEFWERETEEIFNEAFKKLVDEKGFSLQEAKEFLENLYHAVAAEYGD